ncbi:carbohydrate esterase family 8 protein [Rutstroemia sp. NJR-2017a BBW]|nr:carbohydrate esterase family 8 protein [Rutstroemia sp. NJR-2017a BBW]
MKTTTFLQLLAAPLAYAATLNVGSGKTYSTVSHSYHHAIRCTNSNQITAAYNAAAAGDTIYVYPGTYKEKLTISKNDITLKGSAYPSTNPADNDAELIYATYASAVGSNDASATLLITGSGFKMYNMNVTNSAGNVSQAVALSSTGANHGFYACGLKGWQDTLYAHTGTAATSRARLISSLASRVRVGSKVAHLGSCGARALSQRKGVRAVARQGILCLTRPLTSRSKVIVGPGGASAAKGSSFLGRPWGDYARVVFQNSNLGNVITAAGWQPWNSAQDTSNVYFAEYANTNGAGTRVSFAKALSSAVGISTILSNYASWVDSAYLGLSAP